MQCKMARSALGWGVRDLADKAGVSLNTVSHFERGGEAYRSTVDTLRTALEDAGAVFVARGEASLGGGPGVRLNCDPPASAETERSSSK